VGNLFGGTTLYLAHLLDALGQGEVVACDINHERLQAHHPRILPVTGDIASPEVLEKVYGLVAGRTCMVIHDAQHPCEPVLRDLRNLSPLVTVGQYFVVEDGVIDAAHWKPNAPGPMAAVCKFLPDRPEFRADRTRERYGITWNPMGYLERVS
jgi:cephalosporin hydroxylase